MSLSTFEADIQIIDIDTEQAINTRISVSPVNVTVNGFDVRVETWADSKVYGVGVAWFAHTE